VLSTLVLLALGWGLVELGKCGAKRWRDRAKIGPVLGKWGTIWRWRLGKGAVVDRDESRPLLG